MRSIRVIAATALFAMSAVPLIASCTFPLTVTEVDKANGIIRLSWQTVFGAQQYEVQSTFDDNFANTRTLDTIPFGKNEITVKQTTSSLTASTGYRVIASNPSNPIDVQCVATARYLGFGQALVLAGKVRRTIIPVVGSTRGVNDAQFKTSLRLGPGKQQGRIVFHPAGQAAASTDPSIAYNLNGEVLEFDDVVAALGASGIGSLDIVPGFPGVQLEILPVEVRLFNQNGGQTFGGFEAPVQPVDVYRPADWTFYVPPSRFRVNIGVRTMTPAHATFFHIGANGQSQKTIDLPADYMFMQAADQFFGEPVVQGDTIVVHFAADDTFAIPFHTFTDNSTNDPAIFTPRSPERPFYSDLDLVSVVAVAP